MWKMKVFFAPLDSPRRVVFGTSDGRITSFWNFVFQLQLSDGWCLVFLIIYFLKIIWFNRMVQL